MATTPKISYRVTRYHGINLPAPGIKLGTHGFKSVTGMRRMAKKPGSFGDIKIVKFRGRKNLGSVNPEDI